MPLQRAVTPDINAVSCHKMAVGHFVWSGGIEAKQAVNRPWTGRAEGRQKRADPSTPGMAVQRRPAGAAAGTLLIAVQAAGRHGGVVHASVPMYRPGQTGAP
jgi:hypothetical protein